MTISKVTSLFLLFLAVNLAYAGYDPEQGREYASASALAYCNGDTLHSWNCGAPCQALGGYQYYFSQQFKCDNLANLAFSMIFNPSSKRFVTTFRGTNSLQELIGEVKEGGAMGYSLEHIANALVDDYFFEHYVNYMKDTFLQKIQEAHAAFPGYKFVFTGHSLGAAFTTLAAFDAVDSNIIPRDQAVVYNYGSPRVGNYALAQAINAALPEIYRVVHWNDMVPHVPPCSPLLLEHCSNPSDSQNPLVAFWHAWHVNQQIFYNSDHSSYQVCEAEDPNCANQFPLVLGSIPAHLTYVGVSMSSCVSFF